MVAFTWPQIFSYYLLVPQKKRFGIALTTEKRKNRYNRNIDHWRKTQRLRVKTLISRVPKENCRHTTSLGHTRLQKAGGSQHLPATSSPWARGGRGAHQTEEPGDHVPCVTAGHGASKTDSCFASGSPRSGKQEGRVIKS